MSSHQDLPSFADPPVQEVALGIRFDPLAIQLPHVVALWERLRDRLPGFEQQPAIQATPPEDLTGNLQPQVQLIMAPGIPQRYWLVGEDGSELCQIQNDRIVANWRRTAADQAYPRYEYVRDLLEGCLEEFLTLAAESDLGEVKPFQVEVDYVNQIAQGQGWDDLGDMASVISFLNPVAEGELPAPIAGASSFQFLVPDATNPRGRLYLDAVATSGADQTPVMNLVLRMHIPLEGSDLGGAFDGLNFGRETIVRCFAAVTTERMHEMWGREQQ
ncbi:MAG: hypothetical protein QOG85_458 [Gaiellaceae bacterium]|nr:hypothetical protein [Gaiellaceae bacterium]